MVRASLPPDAMKGQHRVGPAACPTPNRSASPALPAGATKVADTVASPVAKKAPASEDQVRAAVGAAFFLLSLYYVISTIAKMAKAARD